MVNLADALKSAPVFTDGDWVESKDQDPDGDVRLVQLADIGVGAYLDKSARFLTSGKAEELRCTFLEPGDILVARMPDPIGRACIFPGDRKKSVTVVDVCVIRTDNDSVDNRWLMHQLNFSGVRRQVNRMATGSTRVRISRKNLGKVEVPIPALVEQKRIAAVLDQVETLRAQRREAIALLNDLAQSIFLNMFSTDLSTASVRLEEVAEVQGGLQVSASRRAKPLEVPYLRVANVYRARLDLTEMKYLRAEPKEVDRTRLLAGDLLVVEGHGNPAEIGRSAVWDGSIEGCVHQNHLIRVRFDPSRVIPEFAEAFLNSVPGRRHLLGAANTTSGLNTISTGVVKSNPMPIPDIGRQREFVRRLTAVRTHVEGHRAHLITLDELFASLQQRAFSGQLWDHEAA